MQVRAPFLKIQYSYRTHAGPLYINNMHSCMTCPHRHVHLYHAVHLFWATNLIEMRYISSSISVVMRRLLSDRRNRHGNDSPQDRGQPGVNFESYREQSSLNTSSSPSPPGRDRWIIYTLRENMHWMHSRLRAVEQATSSSRRRTTQSSSCDTTDRHDHRARVAISEPSLTRNDSRSETTASTSSSFCSGVGHLTPYEEHRRLFGYRPSVSGVLGSSGGRKRKLIGKGPGAVSVRKRSKPLQIWKKEVACLRFTDMLRVPDTKERMLMAKMGLGPTELSFDIEGNEKYLHTKLLKEFPALKDAGGYSLLRPNTNSHDLLIIEAPKGKAVCSVSTRSALLYTACFFYLCEVGGMNIKYLKDILRTAKMYVRPLQRNIEMEAADSSDEDDLQVSDS